MSAVSISSLDPAALARESYSRIDSYRVTLNSRSEGTEENIRYYYKKPGFIRMDFIEPHKGAVLVYDPEKKEVKLRPFGILKSFVLTLSPDSRLIRSAKGHTVDKSDIGALLKNVSALEKEGKNDVLRDEDIGGRKSTVVSVEGRGGYTVDGTHKYLLWLDKKTFLPLKVMAYDADGKLDEEVLMEDLEVNVEFPPDFFKIE